MKYNFDETGDHRQDGSIRWEQPEGRDDIIGMGTADMDFTCAPCIRKVLQPICEENTYNYRYNCCRDRSLHHCLDMIHNVSLCNRRAHDRAV